MLSFFTALLICLVLTPFLIRFAARRKLFDIPDKRKIHEEEIPRLGGVAIAGSLLISVFLSASPEAIYSMRYFLAGLMMLFFVGVWDDLQPVKPIIKLIGELIPVALLTWSSRIPLDIFFVAGPVLANAEWIVTFLVAFWVINAFNLIDGINGLAGTIGLIALGVAAFLLPDSRPLCLSMCGALLAFLFFNFRNPRIFMGDSGSLLIGYCIMFILTSKSGNSLFFEGLPAWSFIFPLISIPLFDMARVFLIRIVNRKNPFKGDRNHLHHLLLEIGISHIGATAFLASLTGLNTSLVFMLLNKGGNLWLAGAISGFIPLLFTAILWQKVKGRRKHASQDNVVTVQNHSFKA